MAAQEALHPGIQEEAQEDLPRVTQHHDERHQRTTRPTNLKAAKMTPVHLCLLAGQAAQPQIRLGRTARPVQRNGVAEVIGTAAIAALIHHREQAAGGQARELLQRLADQRQVGVDLWWPWRGADPGQPGLRQHPTHHAMVHVQLAGDGAGCPLLGVIIAQDLRFDRRRRHHRALAPLDVIKGDRDDAGGGAGTPGGAAAGRSGRTSGSADRAAWLGRPGRPRRVWPSSRPAPTDHRSPVRVNRDASLSVAAPANGPSGQRACGGRDGSPGSAARPAGRSAAGPLWHSLRRSRPDRGRSNCKRSPAGGTRRTGTDGLIAGRAPLCRKHSVDERYRWQDTRPACVPGTMWGTAPMQNCQVARGAVLAPKLWQALAAPSSPGPPSTPAPTLPARFSHRGPASHPLSRSACHTRSYAARRGSPPATRASSPPLTSVAPGSQKRPGRPRHRVTPPSGHPWRGSSDAALLCRGPADDLRSGLRR